MNCTFECNRTFTLSCCIDTGVRPPEEAYVASNGIECRPRRGEPCIQTLREARRRLVVPWLHDLILQPTRLALLESVQVAQQQETFS